MKLILGADHAGYELKDKLKPWLVDQGHEVEDVGAYALVEGDDYPDYVVPMLETLNKGDSMAIFCAGSGEGEAIALNRHKGVRAVVYNCNNTTIAERTRTDNNANVLCIGSRFVSEDEAKEAITVWLATPFDSVSRHARRLDKIDQLSPNS